MVAFLQVTFIVHVGFKSAYINLRANWLRITENKVVIECSAGSTKEYKLKNITDFNVRPLY